MQHESRLLPQFSTNPIGQRLAAIMADDLEDLLDLLDKAGVVDRFSQLDVTKMTGAFRHVFITSLALVLPVDRPKKRIVGASVAGRSLSLVHGLGVDDVSHAHALDLFGREKTELNFFNRLERRARVREVKVRHLVASDRGSRRRVPAQ